MSAPGEARLEAARERPGAVERIVRGLGPALTAGGAFPAGPSWEGLDWRAFQAAVARERVAVLLHYLLDRNPAWRPHFPPDFVSWLKMSHYVSAKLAAQRSRAIGEFLSRARGRDLPVLVLRGAALSEAYYPDPALRLAADEDILVRSADLARAEGLCRTMGLKLQRPVADLTYAGPTPWPLNLDIHTGLWHEEDESALWARALPARLAGSEAFRLGPEDMVLHLAFHAAVHHGRFSPRDALDLAFVCARPGRTPRWDFLLEMTARAGLEAVLGHCLRETRRQTGADIPDGVLERLRLKGFRRWEETFYRRVLVSYDRPDIGRGLTFLAAKGWGRKLRLLRDVLFPPRDFLERRYGLTRPGQVAAFRLLRPLLLLKAGLLAFGKAWGRRRPRY